ncbi:MAG TPA: hypothetical protein RMG48_22175 [Myxococcales bacterium LLY-WYZ-16_1]|jgi:hypothetical protein|nr:hypothetical protein [Myxococcales bacterium LLY-WYZ-16_1]
MAAKLLLKGAAAVAALYAGYKGLSHVGGKVTGQDPDFNMALVMNGGNFSKTYFADGLGKMFLGSRTGSSMMTNFGMFNPMMMGMMYGNPAFAGMMGPMFANPMMMGAMPYAPMTMGAFPWGLMGGTQWT